MAREGWTIGDVFGRAADMFIPGDAYNPKAPSFGEGWTQSGWGRGFSGAQHGDFSALGGELGSIAGGRAIPIIGGQLGRRGGTWLGSLASRLFNRGGAMPEFSEYGPYAGGYQFAPGNSPGFSGFGAGIDPGQIAVMPEFFGDGPGYIAPDAVAPNNYVEIKKPVMPTWQSMGRDDKAHSGWSGVMGKGANGETMIRGVQFFGGLGGGMSAEGQKAYKKRDPSE